ncbi:MULTISPECIES: hypothetical protein [unclassified Rhizobium]|nr:hypothetical protein [Rhizobium sp. BG4]
MGSMVAARPEARDMVASVTAAPALINTFRRVIDVKAFVIVRPAIFF